MTGDSNNLAYVQSTTLQTFTEIYCQTKSDQLQSAQDVISVENKIKMQ